VPERRRAPHGGARGQGRAVVGHASSRPAVVRRAAGRARPCPRPRARRRARPEEDPMRIDLEQALTDIAASVEDDVVAERLGGRVHHMVTRVRRRRAARHAMQGAVGVGTAAAVAVVGVNVAGTGTGTDSAAPTTSPGPTQDVVPASRPLACGQAAPEPTTPAVARGLELELTAPSRVAAGDQVTVEGRLHNRGDAAVPVAGWSTFELVAVA